MRRVLTLMKFSYLLTHRIIPSWDQIVFTMTSRRHEGVTVQILQQWTDESGLFSHRLPILTVCLSLLPSRDSRDGVHARYDVTQSPEQPDRACADNSATWRLTEGQHPGHWQCLRHGYGRLSAPVQRRDHLCCRAQYTSTPTQRYFHTLELHVRGKTSNKVKWRNDCLSKGWKSPSGVQRRA